MAFKQLSKIDKRTKYSVNGWIRNKEKSLGITTVPSMINAICILYFRDDEIFDVINDDDVKLSGNKKIITKSANSANNSKDYNNYGLMKIESTSNLIYQWDLRIVNCSWMSVLFFGITSNETVKSFGDHHYAFTNRGKKTMTNQGWESYMEGILKGDIVSIHLDLNKAQIKLAINGKEREIAYENVEKSKDIKYRLFVSMRCMNDCVEILNFSKQ